MTHPSQSPRVRVLIGQSATTFRLLSITLTPRRMLFVLTLITIIATWFWLCRRFPLLGVASIASLRALLGR